MYKIGIKFINIDKRELKFIAQTLQPFIIEDDYRINSIIKKIKKNEIVKLDIDIDDSMPDFIASLEDIDDDLIEYQIYKLEDNRYEEITKDDLEAMLLTPNWITTLIIISFLGYFIMIFFEFSPIYDLYSIQYTMDTAYAIIASIVTAIIPIVGSVMAYISSTTLSDWGVIKALVIYFWYYIPLLSFFIYMLLYILFVLYQVIKSYLVYYWYKYRHPEFEL